MANSLFDEIPADRGRGPGSPSARERRRQRAAIERSKGGGLCVGPADEDELKLLAPDGIFRVKPPNGGLGETTFGTALKRAGFVGEAQTPGELFLKGG